MEKCKMYRGRFDFSRIVKRVQTDLVQMDQKSLIKINVLLNRNAFSFKIKNSLFSFFMIFLLGVININNPILYIKNQEL